MFRGRKIVQGQKKALGKLWKIVLPPTLLVFAVCLVWAGSKTYTVDPDFASFVATYEKAYSSGSEYVTRQSIFQANVERIEEFNSREVGYTLATNQFSDLTEEEARLPAFPSSAYQPLREGHSRNAVQAVPAALDWSAEGVVTEVKDERNCHTSWIFSAVAAAESLFAIENKKQQLLLEFSEQAVLDCCPVNLAPCVDGLPQDAFTCMRQEGMALEDSYPYDAYPYICHAFNSSFAVGGSAPIPSNSYLEITQNLQQNPLVVMVDASPFDFLHYRHGVYNSTECSTNAPNHSLLLVGFNSTANPPYYKLKNSWGLSWGENGYIRMAMNMTDGPGMCGVQAHPLMPLRA